MLIMQISKTGSTGWYKHYSGAQQSVAAGLCKSYDGGFTMAGYGITAGNDTNAVVIRTDNGGDSLWTATEQCGGNKKANGIAAVNGNYYVIAGTVTRSSGYTDAFAWKLNNSGGKIFYKTYGCGYHDGAQAVCQMPDLSYILGGYKSNSTNRHGWIVKIGEWGDTVSTYTYATDYDEQFNDVTVNATRHIAGAGTQNTATSTILVWHPQYDYIYYPRWIWVNNVYRKSSSNDSLDILGNDSNTYKLKTYLTTLKYSGIVITRFEDIVNDNYDSTITKYTQLHALIDTLRSAGIANIVCQFRSNEKDSAPSVSFAAMDKLLDSLIVFNTQAGSTYKTRFNGLMLDYEIWNDDYGIGDTNCRFCDVVTGWQLFKQLCDSFTTASNNAANHLPTSVVWIGNICHVDTLLDLDGSGSDTTTAVDHQIMISKIDSFRFDRVVLSFFLDDSLVSAYNVNVDPTAFLLRTNQKQANWFRRLWYFGHDTLNIPTQIIPHFHAGHESPGGGFTPKLENYLNGTGPYWTAFGKHYLYQAETEFMEQYNDDQTMITHFSHDSIWGSINIDGFEWFRYNIGPLEYDSLATRLDDAKKCVQYISLPLREQTYYNFYNSKNDAITVQAYPNPSTGYVNIKIENCNLQGKLRLDIYDVTGRDITNCFDYTVDGCLIKVVKHRNYKGLIICKIYKNENYNGTCKVVVQ